MSYGTVLPQEFFDDLAVIKLLQGTIDSIRAIILLLELRNWSANAATDGYIPEYALRAASQQSNSAELIEILVAEELAQRAPDGWQLDWGDQKTAESRGKQKAKWQRQNAHRAGDHSQCGESWSCRKGNTGVVTGSDSVGNAVTKRKTRSAPSAKPTTDPTTVVTTEDAPVATTGATEDKGKVRKGEYTNPLPLTDNQQTGASPEDPPAGLLSARPEKPSAHDLLPDDLKKLLEPF